MSRLYSLLIIVLFTISCSSNKENYNLNNGIIADGYDVVAYFSDQAIEGKKEHCYKYEDVKYHFINEENMETFKSNPDKYIPQYGGFCAYAIGKNGKKVGINPKTYEIRDGKLYLFYNSLGTNTLNLWLKENPEELQKNADKNWENLLKATEAK